MWERRRGSPNSRGGSYGRYAKNHYSNLMRIGIWSYAREINIGVNQRHDYNPSPGFPLPWLTPLLVLESRYTTTRWRLSPGHWV